MDVVQGLHRAATLYPNKVAVIEGEQRYTWREFDGRNRQLANALIGLGVKRGERATLLMLNSFRYLELYYAIPRSGALLVPLNFRFSPQEVIYTVNDSDTVVLFVDDTFVPLVQKIRDQLTTVRHFVHVGNGPAPEGFSSYEALLTEASQDWQDVEMDENEVAGLFYTGGTTGNSRGVMLTHRNIMSNAMHVTIFSKYEEQDVYLHVAPMFHLADGASTFAVTMMGGTHVFLAAFDPRKTLEAIQKYRVTATLLVPTMINILIQLPSIADYDLSSWRSLLYGASPIPTQVLRKAMEMLPCGFQQGYGMTEAAPVLTALTIANHKAGLEAPLDSPIARRLESCGQAVAGVEVRVVNTEGKDVKPGEVGEIIARGPNIMKGYWKLPDQSANVLRDGWYYSGDLATIDDEMFIYIVDRAKDMIISGGENIYSVEVENALYRHPSVLEAAVIGTPSEQWGEEVRAVVVLKPNTSATEEELIATCREYIAGYKVPRGIEFADQLAKSGAGKILKRNLRDKHWQGQTRQVH